MGAWLAGGWLGGSVPQSLGTTATPQFAGVGIGAAGVSGYLILSNADTRLSRLGATFAVIGDGTTNYIGLGLSGSVGVAQLPSTGLLQFSSGAVGGTVDLAAARNAAGVLEVNNGTAGTFRDIKVRNLISNDTAFLVKTTGTLANGAGASTGTLTNAPAATNPTKWIPIDDNGTTRHVPAW